MARLRSTPRGDVTLFIEKLRGASAGPSGISFNDNDGARIFIEGDALAHIISVTFHELKTTDLEEVLRKLCTCK